MYIAGTFLACSVVLCFLRLPSTPAFALRSFSTNVPSSPCLCAGTASASDGLSDWLSHYLAEPIRWCGGWDNAGDRARQAE